jgi:hypothetical protein
MSIRAYGIFIVIELLFLWAICAVTGPEDRRHNAFVIDLSIVVWVANLVALIVYLFKKTELTAKTVAALAMASMVSMMFLAITCPPNLEVPRGVFSTIDSALTSETKLNR